MKIDRPIGKVDSNVPSAGAAHARKSDDTAPKPSSTQVQLSPQMQLLEGQMSLGSSSTFDAQKVLDIQAAINEGRFQVNAGNVADILIVSVQELIRSNPSDGQG